MMCGPTVRAALSFSPLASVGESPIPAFPKGKEHHHNYLKHSRNEPPPLGEGMGRGFHKQQQL